jgi:hypothetical protein
MWATDVQDPQYGARLRAVEARLPNATVIQEVGW